MARRMTDPNADLDCEIANPKPATGLADVVGVVSGRVVLSWVAPTLRTDDTAIHHIRRYIVTLDAAPLTTTTATTVTVNGLEDDVEVTFGVTVEEQNGNRSTAATHAATPAAPEPPP